MGGISNTFLIFAPSSESDSAWLVSVSFLLLTQIQGWETLIFRVDRGSVPAHLVKISALPMRFRAKLMDHKSAMGSISLVACLD